MSRSVLARFRVIYQFVTFKGEPLCGVIFRLKLELLSVFLRSRVCRTLYDLYIPYLQPQVMVKFTRRVSGHFVTITESRMHLIECSPGVISPKPSLILLARTNCDLKKHEVCIFSFSFSSFRAIRFNTAEQFFLVATRCSHGHRPLIFFITLLFTVLVVSCVCKCF